MRKEEKAIIVESFVNVLIERKKKERVSIEEEVSIFVSSPNSNLREKARDRAVESLTNRFVSVFSNPIPLMLDH